MRFPWTKKSPVLTVDSDILRLIAVELHYRNLQSTAREVCGKPLHELDQAQLKALGRWMLPVLRDLFNIVTPASLTRDSWQHKAGDPISFFYPNPD